VDALEFALDDPTAADVVALLEVHVEFSREVTPAGHVHAFEPEALRADDVDLFSIRRDGVLLGIGALRRLDADHAEIKSMHTTEAERGKGIGRLLLDQLLATASARGHGRVSLETGTMEAFAPARALYESAGFEACAPFGNYWENPNSVCMTLMLNA